MAADCEPVNLREIRRARLAWSALLVLLLTSEAAWLTFDARARHNFGLLARPSELAQVLIAAAAAILVVGASRVREIVQRILQSAGAYRVSWLWLALHVAGFALLVALVTGGRDLLARRTGLQVGGLYLDMLLTAAVVFWLAALAPVTFWVRVARDERLALLAGALVGTAAWGAGQLTQLLWRPLSDGTFVLVERLLRPIYPALISQRSERVIGTEGFLAEIGPECSGYEGIGLIAVFLAAFFWLFRQRLRFPQAWLLWPVSIAAIWLLNAVRIALLIVVGTSYSPAAAIRGFHSQAGWLFFNLVALGMMAGALRLPFFRRRSPSEAVNHRVTPVVGYLLPFLLLILTNMLAEAFSEGFDWLYPAKVLVTAGALWWFRDVWQGLAWRSWPVAVAVGSVVFGIWLLLATGDAIAGEALRLELAALSTGQAALWLVFRVTGSVITVPLAEELAFRGYLMRRLASEEFDQVAYQQTPWWAVAVSSVLFGLMHESRLAGLVAGLCYAFVARRRGRLGEAVVAHATTNALIAADVLLLGAWRLW